MRGVLSFFVKLSYNKYQGIDLNNLSKGAFLTQFELNEIVRKIYYQQILKYNYIINLFPSMSSRLGSAVVMEGVKCINSEFDTRLPPSCFGYGKTFLSIIKISLLDYKSEVFKSYEDRNSIFQL